MSDNPRINEIAIIPTTVRNDKGKGKTRKRPLRDVEAGTERYRIEVGHEHGVKPGNIVGAIANEAGLDGEHIGQIEIEADFSLVDLPVGMPKDIFMDLKKVRVCGRPMNISRLGDTKGAPKRKGRSKPKGKPKPAARKKKRRKPSK